MAIVKIKQPKITVIEYRQEIADADYMSCLWARFYCDEDNYTLQIESDCGSYGYAWIPTPETESFLHLMIRVNRSYLLGKISDENVVDGDATYKNVREYLEELLDGEEPDFDYEDIENVCYYSGYFEVQNAIWDAIKNTNANTDYIDTYYLLNECIVTTYPGNAKKIVEVFDLYIKPKIREILNNDEEHRCKDYTYI